MRFFSAAAVRDPVQQRYMARVWQGFVAFLVFGILVGVVCNIAVAVFLTRAADFRSDNIFGNMSRVGVDSWYIGCYGVSPSGQKSQETVTTIKSRTRLTSQPWAYNTLECYGCRSCATYPTMPSVFTKLQLTQGSVDVSPAWIVNPKPSSDMKCKEGVTVASPSTQTIYFNGPPPPSPSEPLL